ncbi:hypothetical protein ACQZ46_00770 [Agrobacterium salinitolerans]
MDFLPITLGELNAHVSMVLEPRRADPAWLAAYHDAYALAETVWPTRHAHSGRDIYACLAADLLMATAHAQPAPKPSTPQSTKPAAEKRTTSPKKTRKTYSQIRAEQVRETQEVMKQIRNKPALEAPRRVQETAVADTGSVGYGPSTTSISSGWAKAFARVSDAR